MFALMQDDSFPFCCARTRPRAADSHVSATLRTVLISQYASEKMQGGSPRAQEKRSCIKTRAAERRARETHPWRLPAPSVHSAELISPLTRPARAGKSSPRTLLCDAHQLPKRPTKIPENHQTCAAAASAGRADQPPQKKFDSWRVSRVVERDDSRLWNSVSRCYC